MDKYSQEPTIFDNNKRVVVGIYFQDFLMNALYLKFASKMKIYSPL